jgi:hypothetical protein
MNTIKACLDFKGYSSKPTDDEVRSISKRIVAKENVKQLTRGNFADFAFEQMQMFPLDFDGKKLKVSSNEILERAQKYDIPISFAYHTPSNNAECERFRTVSLCNVPITDIQAAKFIHKALRVIFPETDANCTVVNMYYGSFKLEGKLLHYDKSMESFDIESLARNMTQYLRDTYGDTNYKRKLAEVAKDTGIALNSKGFIDITKEGIADEIDNEDSISDTVGNVSCVSDTEAKLGVSSINKNLPKSFILIKGVGNNLLNVQYRIKLDCNGTNGTSVTNTIPTKRTPYRSDVLDTIGDVCRLYREFKTGTRILHHDELQGIALNLIHV